MSELYLFDNAERLLSVTNPTEAVQSEELNKMITFHGTIPYSDTMRKVQYIGHKDADDSNNFHLYRLTNNKPEGLSKVPITGVHTFFDDMSSDGYIKDYRPTNKTVLEIVTKILDGSRWKVGVVQTAQRATTNFYYLTRLDSLSKLVDLTGVEIRPRMVYSDGKITSRYLDVYDRLGADRGKIFQHGVDLLTVTENNNLGAIYTAAVGRGRGEETESGFGRKLTFADVEWSVANGNPVNKPVGQEYVELIGQTKLYGFANGTKPRIAIIDFSDEEDQEKLLTSTYDWLVENSRPKTEYSSTVARAGDCKLGDTVGISKPSVGIKYKTRIFKIERNLLNRNKTKFGIGDKLTKSSYEREKFLVNQIEQAKDDTVYWLDSLKKQIVSSYFNEDGYNYDLKAGNEYGLPAGYYSFDKPIDQDPSKVIYMGAGKLAIANSKLPTGEWNWTTMATGDGMTLDAVNSGVLTSGRIQSPDGKSYWDLDNGDVVLNVNKLTINANPVATQKDLEAIELTQGPAGKGIVSTELRYLLTSQATGVTRNSGTWGTVVQTPTATQRYVWAYRIERYSDGTSATGEPYVLSVFGEKGIQGLSHHLFTTNYQYNQTSISHYSTPGYTGTWAVNENTGLVKIGDTVTMSVYHTEKLGLVYILATVKAIASDRSLTTVSKGLIDKGEKGTDGRTSYIH
ncbi:phage tail spike protein, partial [Streptococcus porci]|uniref:phage tail spike protein n=1 Tax=Streptococcus porci TaxID=502567 RepID=UPI0004885598